MAGERYTAINVYISPEAFVTYGFILNVFGIEFLNEIMRIVYFDQNHGFTVSSVQPIRSITELDGK